MKENLSTLGSIISGEAPKGLRASIVINAASAFWISGNVSSIIDGVNKADQIIESGTLSKWLTQAKDFCKMTKYFGTDGIQELMVPS